MLAVTRAGARGAAGLALVLFAARQHRGAAGHGGRAGAGPDWHSQQLDAPLGRRRDARDDPRTWPRIRPIDVAQGRGRPAHRRAAGARGIFGRCRQLLATGAWKGPRDAAESFVEEEDLAGAGRPGGGAGRRRAAPWSPPAPPPARAGGGRRAAGAAAACPTAPATAPASARPAWHAAAALVRRTGGRAPGARGKLDGVIPTPEGEPGGPGHLDA